MKRNAFVLWSLVLLVVALAGVWSVRAQEGHTVYLPVISYTSSDLPVIHYFRTPSKSPIRATQSRWNGPAAAVSRPNCGASNAAAPSPVLGRCPVRQIHLYHPHAQARVHCLQLALQRPGAYRLPA